MFLIVLKSLAICLASEIDVPRYLEIPNCRVFCKSSVTRCHGQTGFWSPVGNCLRHHTDWVDPWRVHLLSKRLIVSVNCPGSVCLLKPERLKRNNLCLIVTWNIVSVDVFEYRHWANDTSWWGDVVTLDIGRYPLKLKASYGILLVIGSDLVESNRTVDPVNALNDPCVIIPRENPYLLNGPCIICFDFNDLSALLREVTQALNCSVSDSLSSTTAWRLLSLCHTKIKMITQKPQTPKPLK